jgi:hemoglobin
MTYGPDNKPYDELGGETTVRAIVQAFYDDMDLNPARATIRALHPDDLESSREKLFEFLSGWLGGPELFVAKHGHPRLRQRHAQFPIGTPERDQWLACMAVALDANNVEGDLRQFLDAQFAHVADFMRNRPG